MKLLAVLTSCVVAVSAKWPHPRQGQEHVDNVPASFDCAMRKVSSVSACTVTLYSVLVLFFFPFLTAVRDLGCMLCLYYAALFVDCWARWF